MYLGELILIMHDAEQAGTTGTTTTASDMNTEETLPKSRSSCASLLSSLRASAPVPCTSKLDGYSINIRMQQDLSSMYEHTIRTGPDYL